MSSFSETLLRHSKENVEQLILSRRLGADSLVIEIASNDGSLLECFRDSGVRILGVEPARNIARVAASRGIPTENRFFTREEGSALRASHGTAAAVIGNNVLAHVDDTAGFLQGAAALYAGCVALVDRSILADARALFRGGQAQQT